MGVIVNFWGIFYFLQVARADSASMGAITPELPDKT